MNYNIYIDESCHLPHDRLPVIGVGYIKVPTDKIDAYKKDLREIKMSHKTPTEVKWTGLSSSRLSLYKQLTKYFFTQDINFRCLVNRHKEKLNHEKYNEGDANKYHYKLIYMLLDTPINPSTHNYRIYLDIKDTRGKERLDSINNVFVNQYGSSPFGHLQHIRSDESIFLQLADIFLGAITYKIRQEHLKPNASKCKVDFINFLEGVLGFPIDEGTSLYANKFNIFDHMPNGK